MKNDTRFYQRLDAKALLHSLLVLVLVSFTQQVAATKLYKVVKPDGSVIYTDQPQAGAEPIKLNKTNSATMPSLAPRLTKNANPALAKRKSKALPEYQVGINSPADQASIRSNNGDLNVSASMTPSAKGEYMLFMNDQLMQTQTSPSFALKNVSRGEQRLQVKFKHHSGKVLASSPIHTIYLQRASILNRAN